MTEINNTVRAGQITQQQAPAQAPARRGPEPTVASANRLPGLASGINTDQTLATLMQVERRRLEPIEAQKATTNRELQAFELINQGLQNLAATAEKLKGSGIWEGKIVESSNEDVVTATATAGAKPGKHTLVVDRLALNHQLASQGYEKQEDQVGTGKFIVTVGEGNPITVVVDESANTLLGLRDAINFATDSINATIIKTGNRTAPYQLVLTSQITGSEGRISLDVQLQGGAEPNFENSVQEPSGWSGVGEPVAADKAAPLTGVGASNAIVQVIGDYTGETNHKYTFTAVQTGEVGGEKQLQVRWKDDSEPSRSGILKLDALNYAPGKPLEFVDGLALIFSEGEVIVNDSFTFNGRAERSDLMWWVPPEERPAAVSTPTTWQRQQSGEFGAPVIGGKYAGANAQTITLTAQGSGQLGRAPSLNILWETEDGETGILNVGQGYEPGGELAINQGLTVSLKPGVLSDGQTVSFAVTPEERSSRWWLDDAERVVEATIGEISNWSTPGVEEAEAAGFMPEIPEGEGPRISTSQVSVTGTYVGDQAKVFTFTVQRDGSIGTTQDLTVVWDDSQGNTGQLLLSEAYQPGTPLPFAEGLSVAFGAGRLFKDDLFTVRTRTATIQPPQDALIRFGATELGGGLEITSPTNMLDSVIEGVQLNLVSTSDRPVTITIRGDTEQALEVVKTFVSQYNELTAVAIELSKFDKNNNMAAPLLGNRDLANIRNALPQLMIDPVAGLPKTSNMLMSVGITLNDQGLLTLDESTLQGKIGEDFGLVADLFRTNGESDNSNVAFVGMTDKTRVSTEGYPVEVEQLAAQGSYETTSFAGPIVIDEQNNRFFISVDGRQSDQLTLQAGSYNLGAYARMLQDAITNDPAVGQRRVRVMVEGDKLRIVSGRWGSAGSISFLPVAEELLVGPGLMGGQSVPGRDVQGTIGGIAAEGNGQLLRAPENAEGPAGLRVFVKLAEGQLNANGPEGTVKVTRGVASRVGGYLNSIVNPLTGEMRRITQNLRDQVGSLDDQLKRMEARMESKRKRLQERFARLESQLSTLKSQGSYMKGQLSGLGGGGSGLPGL